MLFLSNISSARCWWQRGGKATKNSLLRQCASAGHIVWLLPEDGERFLSVRTLKLSYWQRLYKYLDGISKHKIDKCSPTRSICYVSTLTKEHEIENSQAFYYDYILSVAQDLQFALLVKRVCILTTVSIVKMAYQHMLKKVAVLMENIQSSAWIREEMIGPWKCIKK